jgi:hypothetical protein
VTCKKAFANRSAWKLLGLWLDRSPSRRTPQVWVLLGTFISIQSLGLLHGVTRIARGGSLGLWSDRSPSRRTPQVWVLLGTFICIQSLGQLLGVTIKGPLVRTVSSSAARQYTVQRGLLSWIRSVTGSRAYHKCLLLGHSFGTPRA